MQTKAETAANTEQMVGYDAWLFLAGPGCIFCTLALAISLHKAELFYWLSISLLGSVCSARYQMRGFIYAAAGFFLCAVIRHGWFIEEHLWSLGIESSLVCGLLTIALAAEHRQSSIRSLRDISAAQLATIGHLEQNVAALMSSSQAQQLVLQEKIAVVEKELEETQSELSSIVILNEVLRKTSAGHMKESTDLAEALLDRDRRIGYLLVERDGLSQSLARVLDESRLNQEKHLLLEALQASRNEELQLGSLVESYADLQGKCLSQENTFNLERQSLLNDLAKVRGECQQLQAHVQQLSEELAQSLTALQHSEQGKLEKEALQERLRSAELEVSTLTKKLLEFREISSRQPEKEGVLVQLTDAQSQLKIFEERLQQASQTDALYRQLREQFAEKNVVLEQARAQIFQLDTKLQQLQLEKTQKELETDPFSPEFDKELSNLERELQSLQEENEQLQQIISRLT